jgi:HPt (histidine-containing phosphotransfer) domain-containing protein
MSVATYNYIQLDYLETMTEGDADMMQTMLEMLITEIPEEIEKMQVCVASKDWKELFELSHKMKTTLSFVGNTDMINTNKTLEHCSRFEESIAEIPAMVQKLADLTPHVIEELQQVQ